MMNRLRIGVGVGELFGLAHHLDDICTEVRQAAFDSFDSAWFVQMPSRSDALTLIATVGREVQGIDLGTSVVPIQPRHPAVMAQQALTVQAATGGRLLLGLGLSHQFLIENFYGLSYDRPARQMRDYLQSMIPLMRDGKAPTPGVEGAEMTMSVAGADEPPVVLLAALAPRMLELAGGMADGTITWMTGPRGLREHIVPRMGEAAARADRSAPQVVVGLPVCVSDDLDDARQRIATRFAVYRDVPSYRPMLDMEKADGPEDIALLGDEATVTEQIRELVASGMTELLAVIYGTPEERQRSRALLTGTRIPLPG